VLTRLIVLLSLAVGLLTGSVGTATGQAPECSYVDEYGVCQITIGAPSPPGTQPVRGGGGSSGGGERQCAEYGVPVPCSTQTFGTYSNDLQCYLRLRDPQPPPDSPLWEGNYPEGAVYSCSSAFSYPGTIGGGPVWLPGPPDGGLTPEPAAQVVVRRMDLRAADIGIVPEDEPGRIGAVGAPVYMWTTAGPATFGPQMLTGSAGGVTITATAKVDRVVWSMGDGTTVTCRTPGTPYEDRFGFRDSPDCGHRYTRTSAGRPANAYPVSATSFWVVDWTGPAGSSGLITLDLASSTSIVVGELQALVTR
jgi:hypothetical protein